VTVRTLLAALGAVLLAPWATFADRVRRGPWAPSEAHLAFAVATLTTAAVLLIVAALLGPYGWPTTIAAVVLLGCVFAATLGAVDLTNRRDRSDGRL
jgi:uncharacterized membrane protein YdbT with pleckstrin-like domain